MALDDLGRGVSLGEFRLVTAGEILALLRRALEGNVLLHLNTPGGATYTTTLWAIDTQRRRLSLAVDGRDVQLQQVLESDEVTVVGYLDSVKIQFELQDTMLVHGGRHSALSAPIPHEMFRFQRRQAFRVRPAPSQAPTARFAHPMIPEMMLGLRVLDLSGGGCALFLPDDVPPLAPGVRINNVQLDLDPATRLRVSLQIHHVTGINPDARGVRLGCEMLGMNADATRTLQVFIDQTQKRRRQLSLD